MRTRLVLQLFVALLIAKPFHTLAGESSRESNPQLNKEVVARLEAIKAAVAGKVRVVDCNATFGYDKIQRAIDSVAGGDVVVVLPRNHMGITCEGDAYVERIDFNGKAITVQSLAPEDPRMVDKTVIDGAQKGCVVVFSDHPGRDSVLNGLTIRGGSHSNGGGVLCWAGCPTIRNCAIAGNTAKDHGGGIYLGSDTNAVIRNCRITSNTAAHGGGIASTSGLLTISNCLIAGNRAIESGGGQGIRGQHLAYLERLRSAPNVEVSETDSFVSSTGMKGWKTYVADQIKSGYHYVVFSEDSQRVAVLRCSFTGDLKKWEAVFERAAKSLEIE